MHIDPIKFKDVEINPSKVKKENQEFILQTFKKQTFVVEF